MATRIYLPSSGTIEIPNNPNTGTWTETTGFDRVKASTSRSSTAMTNKTQSRTNAGANSTWLDRQYVMGPLAAQTYGASTIKGTIRALESATNDNVDAMRLLVRVVAPDGTTFRGTIYGPTNSTVAEFNTSLRAKRLATGGATSSVSITEGDFLVIEIGATTTGGGASISTSINYGDNSATDLGDNETDTAANNPFVELAANMKLLGKQYGQAQARIKAIGVTQQGQAQAQIKQTYRSHAQAQASITTAVTRRAHGQAQARITTGIYTALDTFTRSVSDGVGTADTGGDYTALFVGGENQFDVDGSKLVFTANTTGNRAWILLKVSHFGTARQVQGTWTITSFGAATGTLSLGLIIDSENSAVATTHRVDIQTALDTGNVNLVITRGVSSDSAALGTTTVGDSWNLVLQELRTSVTTTRLRAKAWKVGDSEPGWQLLVENTTINTDIDHTGFRVGAGNSSTSATLDNFQKFDIGWTYYGQAQATIIGLGRGYGQAAAQITENNRVSIRQKIFGSKIHGPGETEPLTLSGLPSNSAYQSTFVVLLAGDSVTSFGIPSGGFGRDWIQLTFNEEGGGVESAIWISTTANGVAPASSVGVTFDSNATLYAELYEITNTTYLGAEADSAPQTSLGPYSIDVGSNVLGFASLFVLSYDAATSAEFTVEEPPQGIMSIDGPDHIATAYYTDTSRQYQILPVWALVLDNDTPNNVSAAAVVVHQIPLMVGQAQAYINVAAARVYGQAQAQIKQVYRGYGQTLAHIKTLVSAFAQTSALITRNSADTYVQDTFTRASIGSADSGGAYTVSVTGGFTGYSVTGSTIHFPTITSGIGHFSLESFLTPTINNTTYIEFTYSALPSSGNGTQFGVGTNEWSVSQSLFGTHVRAAVLANGDIRLRHVTNNTSGTTVDVTAGYVVGETWAFKTSFVSLNGGNRMLAKVWKLGTAEPDWQANFSVSFTINRGHVMFRILGNGDSAGTLTLDNLQVYTYYPQAYGLAQAQIKNTYYGLGQAQGQIKQVYSALGQAQGQIKQVYYAHGQTQAQIKQVYYALGQAQAQVKNTYFGLGQAQGNIKNTYRGHGQAQASIVLVRRGSGQAQARIKNTYFGLAQTQAFISYNRLEDTFTRNLAGQLGTADIIGGTWQSTLPAPSVDGNFATVTLPTGDVHISNAIQTRTGFNGVHYQLAFKFTALPTDSNARITLGLTGTNEGLGVFIHSTGALETSINNLGEIVNSYVLGTVLTINAYLYPLPTGDVYVRYVSSTGAESTTVSTFPPYISGAGGFYPVLSIGNLSSNTYSGAFVDSLITENWLTDWPSGQAQASIKATSNGHGQAEASIQKSAGYGQAQATISRVTPSFGQAQTRINSGGPLYWVRDTFTRTLSNDLGTADTGQTYNLIYYESDFEVDGSKLVMPVNYPTDGFHEIDAEIAAYPTHHEGSIDFRIPSGGAVEYFEIMQQIQDSPAGYHVAIIDVSASLFDEATLVVRNEAFDTEVYPFTFALDTSYRIKYQATANYVRAKIWDITQPEPDWLVIIAQNLGFPTTSAQTYFYLEIDDSTYPSELWIDNLNITEIFLGGLGQAQAVVKQVYYQHGQAQGYIANTGSNVHGQAQAWIENTYSAQGQAQATIKQVYFALGQAQAQIKQTYNVHGQSNALIVRQEYGSGQAQAQIKNSYTVSGQAQAQIKQSYYAHGQAQGTIKQVYYVHAQAQAWIKVVTSSCGQAQADIKQVYYAHGQAQADIKQTYSAHSQAQGQIKTTYFAHGQAQADIKQVYYVHGQANAWIEQTYSQHGQAQGTILQTYYGHGQAQADVKQTYNAHGQSQGTIKQTYNVHGQANASILNTYYVHGQAQAKINAYGVSAHGQAQANLRFTGTAAFGQAQVRVYAFDYPQHGQAQGWIETTTNSSGQAQGTILQTYYAHGQSAAWIKTTQSSHGQSNACILRTYEVHGQAQAYIILRDQNGHSQSQGLIKNIYYGHGQSNAKINAFDVNSPGQAQGYILAGKTSHGQSQAWIKTSYTNSGQSQAQIKQTYVQHGQSQARIKNVYYVHGQANALIVTVAYGHGQARAWIKNVYYGSGQAQAQVKQSYTVSGQSQADIKQTYTVSGQATALIGTRVSVCGQAQAQIKTTYRAYGQAAGLVRQVYVVHGQAQGQVKNTYAQSGQATAYIELLQSGHGQAQGAIKNSYNQTGQAIALIQTTYNAHGNAQSHIRVKVNSYGQAQGTVKKQYVVSGQAQALIQSGLQGYGQAQAVIYRPEAHGQAQALIKTVHTLANVTVDDDRPIIVTLDDEADFSTVTLSDDELEVTLTDTSIQIILSDDSGMTILLSDEAFI